MAYLRGQVIRDVADNAIRARWKRDLQRVRANDLYVRRRTEGASQTLGQDRVGFDCDKLPGTARQVCGQRPRAGADLEDEIGRPDARLVNELGANPLAAEEVLGQPTLPS